MRISEQCALPLFAPGLAARLSLRAYPRTILASSVPSTSFTPLCLARARARSVNASATA